MLLPCIVQGGFGFLVPRQCQEELQWQLVAPRRVCDLYVGGRLIAWFYLADPPGASEAVAVEAGSEAVWLGVEEALAHPKLSRWHREVLGGAQPEPAAQAAHQGGGDKRKHVFFSVFFDVCM